MPYLARIAAIAAVYYGAAKLGLSLAFETESVTAVWPPTGIALAAVVFWGYRVWPGVALGAFLANAFTDVPLYTALGITAGNTLEALVGAYLLSRVDFRPSLERVRDVMALVVLGGVISTMVSATIGSASLLVGNEIDAAGFDTAWRTWWLGDMGGDIVVAPALLIAAAHARLRRPPGGLLEALALMFVVAGTTTLVFTREASLTYLVIPPMIWAALRFWKPGAALVTLLIAGIAIPLTDGGNGPFADNSPDDRLLLAQAFLGVLSLTTLILAAVITERRAAEERLGRIAETLQTSLLPASLPEIPGIETAVDYRPAGERHIVGGDFYDVFAADDGSWAVVVGDAVGKGATAAATAALARYTLRAAAVREQSPSRILAELNEAILRQSPDQSCTVAYSRLELDGVDGARVILSTGGHPLPMVLRTDGAVERIGSPAQMLGVERDLPLADHEVELSPGDALVIYTDGLTDAYAPRHITSPTQLADALRACAGKTAAEIAAGVERYVLDPDGDEPRDDILLAVLRVAPSAA
jgi:integral membrane sensor domain MASE1